MSSNIAKALVNKVTTTSGVTSLISTRFYDMRLPQGVTLPAATYQLVSPGTLRHHHRERSLLPNIRVQISVFGVGGQHDIYAIDQAIKTALDGSTGNWGAGTYVTEIERCVAETTPIELADLDSGIDILARDYMIMYKE